MTEELNKVGIYVDDLYRFRVLDPEVASKTNELKEECDVYSNQLSEFQKTSQELIKFFENLSKEVEKEKMRAVNVQNLLRTSPKRREDEQQIYQSKIMEKSLELRRLKTEYQQLQLIEAEQQDIIMNFMQNQ